MTRADALELLKLLSVLESWSFTSQQARLPDYVQDAVSESITKLTALVLEAPDA